MASQPLRLCRDLRSAAAVSPSPDVIFEILSWLPAKSLGRCRCVSKEWHALTSAPAFVAVHRSRAEPLLIGMSSSVRGMMTLQLMDTDGTVVQRFPPRGDHWTLRASLGDLACFYSKYSQRRMLGVDLSTGKELLSCFDPELGAAGTLVYSSCGRASQSGSLKVFRLALPLWREDTQLICEVLTLEDEDEAEWRQMQSPPAMVSQWYNGSDNSGVMVTGALHFLSEDCDAVLSFDLDNETWKEIPGPPTGSVNRKKSISIADLNGTLCMSRIVQPLVADIWLLRDPDNNVWNKAYSLPVDLFSDFVIPLRRLRLGGEMLFYSYDYKSKPMLQVYDPRSGKCTTVKTSINLMGRIGLCSSNLDPRFYGQS